MIVSKALSAVDSIPKRRLLGIGVLQVVVG